MKKEDNPSEQILENFEESMLWPNLGDVLANIADISVDALGSMIFGETASKILKEIPLVKNAITLGEAAWNFYRAHTLKKQLVFLDSLAKENADPKALEKRRKAFRNHEKWIYDEVEITLIYLERHSHVEKARIQAILYGDLVNEKIDFPRYMECLDVIDRMFISDIIYEKQATEGVTLESSQSRVDRLQSLGLLYSVITTRLGESTIDKYHSTELGTYIFQAIKRAAILNNT